MLATLPWRGTQDERADWNVGRRPIQGCAGAWLQSDVQKNRRDRTSSAKDLRAHRVSEASRNCMLPLKV